jgi:PKD repeat protein
MKTKLNYLLINVLALVLTLTTNAQTGTYMQTLPNMQSVYYSTQVTFTNTPANATSGTLSCSWLGCQDVGMGNPYFSAQIFINNTWQQLAQNSAASYCGLVNFSQNLSAQTINDAVAAGGGSVLMHVSVTDYCPSGMGCSYSNDPLINNLKLTYNYSKAAFNATSLSICPAQSITFNDTTPGTVLSRIWYFPGGNPATSTSANPTVTYANTGTYAVSLKTISAAGTDSTTKANYIIVKSLPTATAVASGPTVFCAGSNVSLSANSGSGFSYQWRRNNNAITNATTSTYSAKSTGNYNVIVTGGNGCSALSNTIAVTSNVLPTAIISANGATTFCPGGSVLLSATTGNGFTYVWRKSNNIINNATSPTYLASAAGTYKVTVTNNNGCSKTSNNIQVLVDAPSAVITAQGPTTFCNGSGVTLKANTGTGLTYVWKLNGSTINNATSDTYTAYTSGSYKVVVTNGCGNKTSNVINVVVNPLPTAVISANGNTSFCLGSSVTLTVNPEVGSTYKWRKNGVEILNATATSYDASVTGSYTVLATNSFGCTSVSNTINVTANTTAANISASGPTTICAGDSVMLSANTGANLSYQWLKNNATIAGATSASYYAKTAASYKVIVTNTATTCAKTSAAVQVVVNCRLAANGNDFIEVGVAPNPFSGSTTIDFNNSKNTPLAILVYSEDGKLVETLKAATGKNHITIGSKWTSGVYLLKIENQKDAIRLVKKD